MPIMRASTFSVSSGPCRSTTFSRFLDRIDFLTAREKKLMDSAHSTARDNYRLIVTRSNASEILLWNHGSAWCLPSVEIPQGQRIAEQLCAKLYAQCGF